MVDLGDELAWIWCGERLERRRATEEIAFAFDHADRQGASEMVREGRGVLCDLERLVRGSGVVTLLEVEGRVLARKLQDLYGVRWCERRPFMQRRRRSSVCERFLHRLLHRGHRNRKVPRIFAILGTQSWRSGRDLKVRTFALGDAR